jgi:hypothetical protein
MGKNKQDGVLDEDKTMDNVQKHNICNRRIVGRVVFYAARVVSKESRLLVLPRASCSV